MGIEAVMFSYEGVAHVGDDDRVSERSLPIAGCASLRATGGRACVGSRRERSAPFEFPPDAGCPVGSLVPKHGDRSTRYTAEGRGKADQIG